MKCRTKSIEFEAEQFTPERALDCLENNKPFAFGLNVAGHWNTINKILISAKVVATSKNGINEIGSPGDWILKGPNGDLSVCEADRFGALYELECEHPEGRVECLGPIAWCSHCGAVMIGLDGTNQKWIKPSSHLIK